MRYGRLGSESAPRGVGVGVGVGAISVHGELKRDNNEVILFVKSDKKSFKLLLKADALSSKGGCGSENLQVLNASIIRETFLTN